MKRYQSKTPATAFGLAAVAMTAAVLGAGVYLPAHSAENALADAGRIEVSIEPATIEVVGIRTARNATNAHVSEARSRNG